MFKHIFLVIILVGSIMLWEQRPVSHGAGVVAPEEPALQRVGFKNEFKYQHYDLTPRWQIQGETRVLSKKSYWLDDKKHLSPYDMILGWSVMSDERTLNQVQIPISNRHYNIDVIRPQITVNEMKKNLLFVHAIPSNDEINETLKNIREGHVISFKGYIVDVKDQSDWKWISSIGNKIAHRGESQIVWIQELNIH